MRRVLRCQYGLTRQGGCIASNTASEASPTSCSEVAQTRAKERKNEELVERALERNCEQVNQCRTNFSDTWRKS